jgi:hypothetical protein
MVTKARQLAEFIANADVDSDEIATGAVSASKLADTLDLSSKTIVMPDVAAFNITSGDVGIGTSSPANLLNLHQSDTSSNSYLHVTHVDSGTGASNGLSIGLESNGTDAAFRNRESGSVKLYTANTERMRITSSGNVGIGTSSPSYKTEISDGTVTFGVNPLSAYSTAYVGTTTNHGMNFITNGNSRLNITSGGNVGIGTSSPSDLLELSGTTAQPAIRFTDEDVSGLYHRIFTPTNTGLAISADTGNVAADSFLRFDIDGSERMRITSSGNVGIGTSSATTALTVNSGTSNTTATFQSTDAGAYINFTDTTGTSGIGNDTVYLYLDVDKDNVVANSQIRFRVDGSSKVTIKDNGYVGIGTTNPSVNLEVANGDLAVSAGHVGIGLSTPSQYGSGVPTLHLQGTSPANTRAGAIYFTENNGDQTGAIYSTDGSDGYGGIILHSAQGNMKFSTGALTNYRMTIDTAGNVGIGTTSPSEKLTVSGIIASSSTGYTANANTANFGLYTSGSNPTTYIQMPASGEFQVWKPSTAAALIVKNNGDVGIGTESPLDKLHVTHSYSGTYSSTLTKGTNTQGLWVTNDLNGDNMAGIHLGAGGGTHFSSIVGARTANASHWGTHLSFYTHDHDTSNLNTATEKVRITGDGNVGIGTTTPSHTLQVAGNAVIGDSSTTANGILLNQSGSAVFRGTITNNELFILDNYNGSGFYQMDFRWNNSEVGSVQVTSSGATYNTTSDRRLKDNITTITNGKEKLLAMNPVTHTWKADPDAAAVHGFIAQEMQEVIPEAVSGDSESEEMMSMDYGRITPVIVAALQDALKEIEELKTRINELEAK